MNYLSYIKDLWKILLSSSFVLGTILGIALLINGESTMNFDLEFDVGGLEGLWLIIAIPLVSLLVFLLLSPLSFLVHRLLIRKNIDTARSDQE